MYPRVGRLNPQIPKLIKPYYRSLRRPFDQYQQFVMTPPSSVNQSVSRERVDKSDNVRVPKMITSTHMKHNLTESQKLRGADYGLEIDDFLVDITNTSVDDAIQNLFIKKFDAAIVAYYIDVPCLQSLYCSYYNISSSKLSGLVGYAYHSKSIIRTSKPTSHPSYHETQDRALLPHDSPVCVVPLWDYKGNLTSVVQIIRPPSSPDFTDEDEEFLRYFTYKFGIYSRFFSQCHPQESLLLDLVQLRKRDEFTVYLSKKLQNYFCCRQVEFWLYTRDSQKVVRIERNLNEFELSDAGIVGGTIKNNQIVNIPRVTTHPNYNSDVDGSEEEAFMMIPISDIAGDKIYGIVLRGALDCHVFTQLDQDTACNIAPFVATALSNCSIHHMIESELEQSRNERESLAALLEVAEVLSGQLDIDKLTAMIMEKGRKLTHADRCSLFLVSADKQRLITSFQRGLKNSIDIPIGSGIAGKTVKEGVVINIEDAYTDPSFDSSTDEGSGYKTRSILSVPIFNNRGEIIGVTEMVNKMDLRPFSSWDAHIIQIFNVFCGVTLENARLYREQNELSSQLRSFFDISLSLTKHDTLQNIINEIITSAKKACEGTKATMFLVDETTSVLTTFSSDAKIPFTIPLSAGIAGAAYQSKSVIIVNDPYSDPRFNRTIDDSTGFKTKNIIAAPVIGSNGTVFGVLEVVNREGGFSHKDVPIITSFTTFASITLEKSKLQSIAELGSVEVEINKYIGESEKSGHNIPVKLQLNESQISAINSLNFFSIDWQGINHIKELFYIFNKFKILERYKISNEMFFRFVYEIRATYNQVPYHNWVHACDVVQYVAYQISTAKLENVFTPLEIFALLLSAVCHDANHDGFNNVYNLKSETPLGILFKNQSVMETHHCSVAIGILTRDECNLLHSLSPKENRIMWNWITKLILATDMAHHFKMVKETTEKVDNNKFDLKNDVDRLEALELILKVADISNVSRPFELADKWCDVLSEEFWRQGDNELANGLEISSPLNDRKNVDKPKGQIGFYNFICIPLYGLVARIFPLLEVNLNSVKANLEVWKSLTIPSPLPSENKNKEIK